MSSSTGVTDDTLAGTWLKAHHKVEVGYPHPCLLNDNERLFIMEPVENENRYNPLHAIVPDDEIEDIYPTVSYANTNMMTYYNTESKFPRETASTEQFSTGHLASDMALTTQFVGETSLLVATYTSDAVLRVRVQRQTTLHFENGETLTLPPANYESTVTDWTSVRHVLNEWQSDIAGVICGTTDRHIRHTARTLSNHGRNYNDYNDADQTWKAPRQMPLSEGIRRATNVMSKSDLDDHNSTLPAGETFWNCPCCDEPYGDSNSNRAVQLPCSDKHFMCFECLQHWVQNNTLARATCPHCRARIAPGDVGAMSKPNYLDIRADWQYDPLYSMRENFERSFAQDDRVFPPENEAPVRYDTTQFDLAWTTVVVNIPQELNDPARHAPNRFPETELFARAVGQFVRDHEGEVHPGNQVFTNLLIATFRAFQNEWVNNRASRFTDPIYLEELLGNDMHAVIHRDYNDFIRQTLNRMIQVVQRLQQL